ncbi:hypothetical protein P4O66_016982, partial [Electrophorus voltai]
MEIEVYKHHLETDLRAVRACQTADRYDIQPQNQQLRALLFNTSSDAAKVRTKHSLSFSRSLRCRQPQPAIPSNSASFRPVSSQPIMMFLTPMPFTSSQTGQYYVLQYYVPQYHHSGLPYVGHPQQYSVQPTGPSTFYPGLFPADCPLAYDANNLLFAKIRIRDPNQDGKDITEEIMSGVGISQNTSPPVGRPCTTPYCSTVLPHSHSNPPDLPRDSLYTDSPRKGPQLNSQVAEQGNVSVGLALEAHCPAKAASPAAGEAVASGTLTPSLPSSTAAPSGLTLPGQAVIEAVQACGSLHWGRAERDWEGARAISLSNTWKKPKEDTPVGQAQCPDREVIPLSRCSLYPSLHAEPELKDGKRQYDRDFLLAFQFMPACMQKPEGLPPISDVVLDKIKQNKLPLQQVGPRIIARDPGFNPASADFSRGNSWRQGVHRWGPRRLPPRKIITNVSVNDEVQLKKAENAWKPGRKRENTQNPRDPENSGQHLTPLCPVFRFQSHSLLWSLFQKVRSILNKLTPQMFNQLMKQVMDLTIDTEERLKGVVDLVFEKAIDEPSFSMVYGNMCSCLAMLKVPMADKPTSTVGFPKAAAETAVRRNQEERGLKSGSSAGRRPGRYRVQTRCFLLLSLSLVTPRKASERGEAGGEIWRRRRTRPTGGSIGNIKFIGELFKLHMLSEAIMHDCVVKLFMNHSEESLERLCHLLTAIGKDLDLEEGQAESTPDRIESPKMDHYFKYIEKTVKERKGFLTHSVPAPGRHRPA